MPFYFDHADKRIDLDDLPLDSWIAIQEATGKTWPQMIGANTIGDAKVAKAIVAECCKHLDLPVPELTLRQLLDVLSYDVAAESLPTEFSDGIPDPKASDTEQGTT